MTVRFAAPEEAVDWDERVLANPDGGDVWRSAEYARQKERNGYRVRHVLVDELAVTVLEKRVPFLGRWWYLPKGPGVPELGALLRVVRELAPFAVRCGAFGLTVEPRIEASSSGRALLERAGWLATPPIIPNASTILLDVSGSEEEVFRRFDKKARYAVNRARREGVEVQRVPASEENATAMFRLLAETAEGRFGLRPRAYYTGFWQDFEAAGMGQLFFARAGAELLAAGFAMRLGDRSTYKDGASAREHSVYGASHLLQWEIIRWAREAGCTVHDLCGSPPSDRIGDPSHPHHGIGLFKTSFNRTVTDYLGAYTLPLRPGAYRLWDRLGDPLARRLSLWLRHDPYY